MNPESRPALPSLAPRREREREWEVSDVRITAMDVD